MTGTARRGLVALLLPVLSTGVLAAACPGDCNEDGSVHTNKLVIGARVLLGTIGIGACAALDVSGDEQASIDELVAAVDAALFACSTATATATPMANPTATPTPIVTTAATSSAITATPTATARVTSTPFWESLTPLPAAQQEAGVTELNGRVYVIGGFGADGRPTDDVWEYDVAHDTWTAVASLPQPLHHVAAAAMDDRVYAIGGLSGQFFASVKTLYAYDPIADSWTPRADLPRERGAAAAAVIDGRFYVAGGLRGVSVNDFAVYDPSANEWTELPNMPTARDHLAAAAIDGIFYAVGGRDSGALYGRLEAYDPALNMWDTMRRPMPTARGGLAGAAFGSLLFTFGGEGNVNDPMGIFPQCEVYDPATDTWDTLPPMLTPRHGLGAVAVGDVIIVPAGATRAGFGASAANEALHP